MLIVHHLQNSRSHRILWLMEQLGLGDRPALLRHLALLQARPAYRRALERGGAHDLDSLRPGLAKAE